MKSRWFKHKNKVLELRKSGLSYGEIERIIPVPRSTLSHWLRNVELTVDQQLRLTQNYGTGLIKARAKASQWHKSQKKLRLEEAQKDAEATLKGIKIDDEVVELALAMLYLGEGSKNGTTSMGCSNPLVLKFFLIVLVRKYNLDPAKIRYDLHIRADQNPEVIKKHWAKQLGVPIRYFRYVVADPRTAGKASYPDYKGVCLINCGNIAIQRKLISLYNQFCEKVIDEWAVSSTG